jgi:hypothetical protein
MAPKFVRVKTSDGCLLCFPVDFWNADLDVLEVTVTAVKGIGVADKSRDGPEDFMNCCK